jgi:hypothetical protein
MGNKLTWLQVTKHMNENANIKDFADRAFTLNHLGDHYRTCIRPDYEKDPTGATRLASRTAEKAKRAEEVNNAEFAAEYAAKKLDLAVKAAEESTASTEKAIVWSKLAGMAVENVEDDADRKEVTLSYFKVHMLAEEAIRANEKTIHGAKEAQILVKSSQKEADVANRTLTEYDLVRAALASIQEIERPEMARGNARSSRQRCY